MITSILLEWLGVGLFIDKHTLELEHIPKTNLKNNVINVC